MSSQKYRNFDTDDNVSGADTPTGVTYDPSVAFRAGATFWQRRTNLEKALLVIVGIFVLVVVILAAILGSKHVEVRQLQKQELCTTKECVTLASNMLNYIDPAVDPCDDFYQYACGGWIKNNPIPSGHARWSTFNLLVQKNQLVFKNVLESPLETSLSESERKARVYFLSCMDVNNTIQELGAQPMHDLLKQYGGWNISHEGSDPWNVTKWSFEDTLQRVHQIGVSAFFSMFIMEDAKNNTKNIIYVDQGGLGLARDQYLTNNTIEEDPILSAYLTYMTDVGVLLGGDYNDTKAQMTQVIEWEKKIANITTPSEDRRDDEKLYNKMDLKSLQKLSPFIKWKNYLTSRFRETDIQIADNEPVIVYAPEFLEPVAVLVTDMLQTDQGKNTLNNYMKWHLVRGLVRTLSQPFVDATKAFGKALMGVEGNEETWRSCVSDTGGTLGFALGAMFVKQTFKGGSRDKAEEMVLAVKQAFKSNLPNNKWMDPETRRAAIEKVEAVEERIGYPDFILNVTALDEKYKELHVTDNEFFQNNLNSIKTTLKKSLLKLRKPPDRKRWEMTPQEVNAYYTPTKNQIVFPAGILQMPFFDQNYPTSVNYGGMGVVMGHELTHGFDDQGRAYDKNGLLKPWWNNASIENFKKETECFVKEYDSFVDNNEHVKGKQTLGENIADNGGLKAAYHAYEKWISEHGEEKLLPGVDLHHRQLFFLAFAQIWCSNTTPQAEHMALITDPHSPGKFRVLGVLSNSKDFAEQYKCAKDTNMNPTKKCQLW